MTQGGNKQSTGRGSFEYIRFNLPGRFSTAGLLLLKFHCRKIYLLGNRLHFMVCVRIRCAWGGMWHIWVINVPPGKAEPGLYVQITIKTPLGSEPSWVWLKAMKRSIFTGAVPTPSAWWASATGGNNGTRRESPYVYWKLMFIAVFWVIMRWHVR